MVRQSLHRAAVDRFGPERTEYGWMLAVLLGLVLSRTVVSGAVDRLDELPPRLLAPRLLGTVVYATAGTVLLVACAVVIGRVLDPDLELRPEDTVRLPLLSWGLLTVGAYVLLGATELPTFPASLVDMFFGTVLPMGLFAVVYARQRGTEIRLRLPTTTAGSVVGPAVVLAAIAGIAPVALRRILTPAARGPPGAFAPEVPPIGTLLVTVVVVPALVGIVYGLLFNGVIQESFREQFDPVRAVVVATALVGAYRLTATPIPYGGPVVDVIVFTAGVVIPVLSAFLSVRAVDAIGAARTESRTRALAVALGVTAVVVVVLTGLFWSLVLAWVFGPSSVPGVSGLLMTAPVYVAAAAVASVAYERVRSVWVPALAFAVFLAATSISPYLL